MKIDTSNSQAEVLGNVNQHTMGVKISPKMFGMMVDGLYQNKIGSVIRELSSNAYDAHIEAGIPNTPFEITIPTGIHKQLIIKDFGNGLSELDVIKYFGTLFETKKDNDDDYIGGYGIGCKSPFSIVDEFTVISIHKNIKTVVVFLRENGGTPTFFVSSSSKVNEPSGISVIIDGISEDNIIKEIGQQLAFFPVKPNIVNYEDSVFRNVTKIGDISFIPNMPHNYYIAIGPILYPLDATIADVIPFKKTSSIVYQAGIKDVSVPPDRERFYHNSKNVENIKRIVDAANHSYNESIKSYFISKYDGKYSTYLKLEQESSKLSSAELIFSESLKPHIYNMGYRTLRDEIYAPMKIKKACRIYGVEPGSSVCELLSSYHSIHRAVEKNYPIVISNNLRVFDLGHHMATNKIQTVVMYEVPIRDQAFVRHMLVAASKYFTGKDANFIEVNKSGAIFKRQKSVKKEGPVRMSLNGLAVTSDKSSGFFNEELLQKFDDSNFMLQTVEGKYSSLYGLLSERGMKLVNDYVLSNPDCKIPAVFIANTKMKKRLDDKNYKYVDRDDFSRILFTDRNFMEWLLTKNTIKLSNFVNGSYKYADIIGSVMSIIDVDAIVGNIVNNNKLCSLKDTCDIINYHNGFEYPKLIENTIIEKNVQIDLLTAVIKGRMS